MKIDTNKLTSNTADNAFISLMGGTANGIKEIPITQLVETENQPFYVLDDERMAALVDDIKINGVLEPILVTVENGKYRILAGHRRTHASKIAGKETMPCIIKDVKSATEKLIITNTNLTQRKTFLPSELARAYKMQLEGYRELDAHSVRTTAQIAEDNNVSKRTIQYYLKLNHLVGELLELVDEEIITVKAGAELTKLSPEEQELLSEFIREMKIKKLDLNYSTPIVHNSENGNMLTSEYLIHLFNIEKENRHEYSTYLINNRNIENTLFKARQKILLLDNSEKLKKGIVLKNKDYIKLQKAQQKIEEQFEIIENLINKS